MPLFIIERKLAEQLKLNQEGGHAVHAMEEGEETRWFFSFFPADKESLYWLYKAPNLEAIVKAAETAEVPTDVVTGRAIEVRERFA